MGNIRTSVPMDKAELDLIDQNIEKNGPVPQEDCQYIHTSVVQDIIVEDFLDPDSTSQLDFYTVNANNSSLTPGDILVGDLILDTDTEKSSKRFYKKNKLRLQNRGHKDSKLTVFMKTILTRLFTYLLNKVNKINK